MSVRDAFELRFSHMAELNCVPPPPGMRLTVPPSQHVAISVAHAAHVPERADRCKRMLGQLGFFRGDWSGTIVHSAHIETHRGPPHEWSLRQWQGALADERAAHALLLNDDLILCDDFLATLERVIEARPNHIINLYNTHALAHEAVRRGLSWLTSVDGLIGNAYVLPVPALRAFLDWRENALTTGTVEELSEDQLLNLWAMANGFLIWHTVPALVDHDTSIPSCYGNIQMRRPAVGPVGGATATHRMQDVDWTTDAVHVGRVFNGNHKALLTRVKGPRGPLVGAYYRCAGEGI